MDLFESIQQQAMMAVVEPDDEATMRYICRYYSKTYATPLHLVKQLPIAEVLQTFYEDVFGQMDEEAREERIEWLLMSPEDRKDNELGEATLGKRDEEFLSNLTKEVSSGERIKEKKLLSPVLDENGQPLPEGMQALARRIQRTKERAAKIAGVSLPTGDGVKMTPRGPAPKPQQLKPGQRPPRGKQPFEPKAPPALGDLPEINMKFGSTGNLGNTDWGSLDPLSPPPKTKKKT